MTPQQIDAMKLAHETLGRLVASIENPPDCGIRYVIDDAKEAITAIKQALADHAMQEVQRLGQEIEQEPVKYSDYEPDGVHHNKFDTAPPQPEQEPVAFEEWLSKQHGDPEEIGFLQALRIAYISGQDSITTPPQRTWVGLTDEEIDYFIVHRLTIATKNNLAALIRICEAKLKEKNT